MTFSISFEKKVPYIRHPYYENLFVLPYVNLRLLFADLAVKAIAEGGFDLVVLDLPQSYGKGIYLDLIMEAFPLVSSLVTTGSDNTSRAFHFAPNDAACAAFYSLTKMPKRDRNLDFECIDDSNITSYPSEFFTSLDVELPDDYFAKAEGIEGYFPKAFQKMESLWRDLPGEVSFFWEHRARIVGGRLQRLLKQGKKTLFVCNYRLFWAVDRAIRSEACEESKILVMPSMDEKATLVFHDPRSLWARGILDDYPAVVMRFFRNMHVGNVVRFDKLQVLDEILSEVTGDTKDLARLHLSTRGLLIFHQYLLTRLRLHRRMTPTLSGFLFPAADSCIGRPFSTALLRVLLEYPSVDETFISYLISNYKCRVTTDPGLLVPDPTKQISVNGCALKSNGNILAGVMDSEEEREKLLLLGNPFLKPDEIQSLSGEGKEVRWALKEEYVFYSKMNDLVHAKLLKPSRRFQLLRSYGDMADGIDWQETILSRLTGEHALYVRKFKKCGFKRGQLNEFTPLLFVFDKTSAVTLHSIHDSNITQRYIDLGMKVRINKDFPKPDSVNSVFYTTQNGETLCNGHIRMEYLTSILFLCTRPWMGPERYRKITERPPRFRCRTEPQAEVDLTFFPFPDKLAAFGVKYAEDLMVIISEESWKLSAELLTFAKSKGVRILRFPLSSFSEKAIQRMRHLHLMSTALKKHKDQKKIINRFIFGM